MNAEVSVVLLFVEFNTPPDEGIGFHERGKLRWWRMGYRATGNLIGFVAPCRFLRLGTRTSTSAVVRQQLSA